jgi:hypothetical protein
MHMTGGNVVWRLALALLLVATLLAGGWPGGPAAACWV